MTNGDYLHSNGVRSPAEVAAFQAGYQHGAHQLGMAWRLERWLWFASGAITSTILWFAVAWIH